MAHQIGFHRIVVFSCLLLTRAVIVCVYTLSYLILLGGKHVLNPGHVIDRQGLSNPCDHLSLCAAGEHTQTVYVLYVAAHHHHMSRGGLINRTCSHDKLAKGSLTKHLIIAANCSIHYRLIGEPRKGLCYMRTVENAVTGARSVSLYFYRNFFYTRGSQTFWDPHRGERNISSGRLVFEPVVLFWKLVTVITCFLY